MWIVALAIQNDSGVEVFNTYEEAKEFYDEYSRKVDGPDSIFLAEVKASKNI